MCWIGGKAEIGMQIIFRLILERILVRRSEVYEISAYISPAFSLHAISISINSW